MIAIAQPVRARLSANFFNSLSSNCLSLCREVDARLRAAGEGPLLPLFSGDQDVWRTKQSRRTDVPHPDPCASGTSRHRRGNWKGEGLRKRKGKRQRARLLQLLIHKVLTGAKRRILSSCRQTGSPK